MNTNERLEAIEAQLGELMRFARLVDQLAATVNTRLDVQNRNLAEVIKLLRGEDDREGWARPWERGDEE